MAGGDGPLPDMGDSLDHTAFGQILEMDEDDDDHEFSKSIVFGFFEQAESTFGKMDQEIQVKNLAELSRLGHFIKGSSAIIGLTNIKQSCEKIQHWGNAMEETGHDPMNADECLKAIHDELVKMRREYKYVERELKRFYHEP